MAIRPSEHNGGWLYAEPEVSPARDDNRVGKWLVYVSREHVDALWERISAEVAEGRLGVSAKVSTGPGSPLAHDDGSYVVIVYCADWRDLAQVRTALASLRELGVVQRLSFKRDRDTRASKYIVKGARNVSVWGSGAGDTIETKWVGDGRTWVTVTDENRADVVGEIEEQDDIAASLATRWLGGYPAEPDDGWVALEERPGGGYDEHRVAPNGAQAWYRFGQLHREDGPAYLGADGAGEWWFLGRRYKTEAGWAQAVSYPG
ncbi:MAG: putative phosphothreonine lyase domain-containing protein [Pseudolysinimonas sp.]|uniref:putative phosphothreonine lyase domain-containing protein n=1 Tax=Pseudolysinimonas sp. TaxID=2680009 RepID=UPI003264B832